MTTTTHAPTSARRRTARNAIVAATVGALLIPIGGLSLASWSQSVNVLGGFDPEVHFGYLAANTSPASRTLNGATVSPMTGVTLSPGDELVTTVPVTVQSSGTSLTAEAELIWGGWDAEGAATVADQLESWTTVELVPTAAATAAGTTLNEDGTVTFAAQGTPASRTVNAVISIDIPFEEAGLDLRGVEAAIDGLTVQLDQVDTTN